MRHEDAMQDKEMRCEAEVEMLNEKWRLGTKN